MAALAPMPSASVMTAIRVNPGFLTSVRNPCRRSCQRLCTFFLPSRFRYRLDPPATAGGTDFIRNAAPPADRLSSRGADCSDSSPFGLVLIWTLDDYGLKR